METLYEWMNEDIKIIEKDKQFKSAEKKKNKKGFFSFFGSQEDEKPKKLTTEEMFNIENMINGMLKD